MGYTGKTYSSKTGPKSDETKKKQRFTAYEIIRMVEHCEYTEQGFM